MKRTNFGSIAWLPLSLAVAVLVAPSANSLSHAQYLGGGSPPAGNAQWNSRQQDAGYAAKPLYPSTEDRYAIPQQAPQNTAPAQQNVAAPQNTAWQQRTQQIQQPASPAYQTPAAQTAQQTPANSATVGRERQLANFGYVPPEAMGQRYDSGASARSGQQYQATQPQQTPSAGPAERVATQTDADRWQVATNASGQNLVEDENGWKRDAAVVKRLNSDVDKLEMTVSTSRILTIDGKFSRAQVNNPEVLNVTPLAPNELQISALKPGVTQIHLWDDTKRVYSVDVAVYGDVQELQMALQDQYPNSSVKVYRYSNSLVLTGYVDRPDYVSSIVRLSEDYAPKIINNMKVGGVQQILLNVQVMEVSRTKLRDMGFDFANFNGNDAIVSSISGLIASSALNPGSVTPAGGSAGDTVRFGIVDGSNAFFGFVRLLRQNGLAKILAEPKLVTVSGRPATFNSGGEIPVPVPQSLGSVTIEYKKYGTQVDFLPIVLGNGNIRLEVRPRISELDPSNAILVNGSLVPALKERMIDTGVEMKAGQTLALAGLVQNRMEATNRGIPVLADMPWLGAAFRSVHHQNNEIELLILVRPELVQAMDPHEVPPGGVGLNTVDPCDTDLYWRGHLEVPRCSGCNDSGCKDCSERRHSVEFQSTGSESNYTPASQTSTQPTTMSHPDPYANRQRNARSAAPSGRLPASTAQNTPAPSRPVYVPPANPHQPAMSQSGVPVRTANESNPTYPQAARNRYEPIRPAAQGSSANAPGMIGPLGYDVVK